MKKSLKIIIIALVVLCLSGFGAYQYALKGGARDVKTETPAFVVTATALQSEFTADNGKATKKYLNQTILVSGKISSTQKKLVILENNIVCSLLNDSISIHSGKVVLKGRLLGYDDLLGEIKLDQCSLIN